MGLLQSYRESMTYKSKMDCYSDGLILGKTTTNKVVIQPENSKISNRNVFVVGGPGSMKTQSYILSNVVNNRSTSIVVTDPKGEVYELTNEIKKQQGYKTVVVNFKNFLKSSRYNPLLYIRKSSDTNSVAYAIVASKNDPKRKDFWFNAQLSLLNTLIKYVYLEYEPSSRTIDGILDFLEEFDPRYNKEGVSELDNQFDRLPDGHEAKRSYNLGFKKAESEARPNIIISLLTTLQDFLDREVAEFTSTNDFFFEELGTSKIILYVLISPLDRTWEGLINLFFQQMFTEMYFLGDKNNAKLPTPAVLLLDEFVNLGFFPTYENFLATCRGYRISVSTIIQSLPQLQELYGDKKAKAIIGNHAIRICLGGVEETTAEYFSRLVGDTTIKVYVEGESASKRTSTSTNRSGTTTRNFSYQKRRLITEGEIINLMDKDKGRRSIVVIQGKPYMLRKTPQFELFGSLLKKHEVSQNDYESTQTAFARTYLEEMEEGFKENRKKQRNYSKKELTKPTEEGNREIPLPELVSNETVKEKVKEPKTVQEEVDEIDLNDVMESFSKQPVDKEKAKKNKSVSSEEA